MTSLAAAFFRAEGVLLRGGALGAVTTLLVQRAGFRERALGLAGAAALAPAFLALDRVDRTFALRLAHLALRGMSRDRIRVLGEERAADLRRDLADGATSRLRRAADEGLHVVVLSEQIEEIALPLFAGLPVHHVVANRLEYRDGAATGLLEEPVIGGLLGPLWLRQYAEPRGIALDRSVAYASFGADQLLLAGVGRGVAVRPDDRLRRAAAAAGWATDDGEAA
jgi:phosphoserine phosphatase